MPLSGALEPTTQVGDGVPMGQELTVVVTLTDVLRAPVTAVLLDGPVARMNDAAPPIVVCSVLVQPLVHVKLASFTAGVYVVEMV